MQTFQIILRDRSRLRCKSFQQGQKALVTGGSSGIGKAVAQALGGAGADVVVNYISSHEEAQEVVDSIKADGGNAIAIRADVSKEDEVQAMFAQMIAEFGTIDILINNAGLQKDAEFDEMTLDQWNKVISVNLTGQFLCAREAVREFKRRGMRGASFLSLRRSRVSAHNCCRHCAYDKMPENEYTVLCFSK